MRAQKEVHMRISSPPIKCPCFFGIDTPSHDQLIGAKNSVEEIRKLIGADTLSYLSIEDLLKRLKVPHAISVSAVSTESTPKMCRI